MKTGSRTPHANKIPPMLTANHEFDLLAYSARSVDTSISRPIRDKIKRNIEERRRQGVIGSRIS
jgi:hypothetical protein